ncbi:hypothetical protein BAB79_14790 [Mycobacteroides abscessus]|nr:hypothetical protein A3O06_14795 [Mycobacteroides abscessus]ANO24692.1 hypothetical protein BAB79_14790 [Mycobacteroides abscessus]
MQSPHPPFGVDVGIRMVKNHLKAIFGHCPVAAQRPADILVMDQQISQGNMWLQFCRYTFADRRLETGY